METALLNALKYMSEHPQELEASHPELTSILQSSLQTNGQGTGNKVTSHETCIAHILESNMFGRAPRGTIPKIDGIYYWYQLQGSQQSGDFYVFEVSEGVKKNGYILDAKHSEKTSIYLNDGTFEPGTIYIVSFTRLLEKVPGQRKKPRENVCFIGLGEDIFTEKDRESMARWKTILRSMNETATETDHLRLYARSANQYDCRRFTTEFTSECWNHIQSLLSLTPQ